MQKSGISSHILGRNYRRRSYSAPDWHFLARYPGDDGHRSCLHLHAAVACPLLAAGKAEGDCRRRRIQLFARNSPSLLLFRLANRLFWRSRTFYARRQRCAFFVDGFKLHHFNAPNDNLIPARRNTRVCSIDYINDACICTEQPAISSIRIERRQTCFEEGLVWKQ